jgi:cytochrome P450
VWLLCRHVDNNYTLSKYTVPAGSTITMSQYLMHLDPSYYNEPDRFDRAVEFGSSLPRFSYFPFGGGRACIVEAFAWLLADNGK